MVGAAGVGPGVTAAAGSSWRDADDRSAVVPPLPGPDAVPFYLPIGEFQGGDYRRNAFAAGTDEEVSALQDLAGATAGTVVTPSPGDTGGLPPGSAVLDVGCGDARHLRALLSRQPDLRAVGIDISPGLIAAGRQAAPPEQQLELLVGDARNLSQVLGDRSGAFDVAWSLCQGALGTSPVTDPAVLRGLAGAVRPGGLVLVTLFHALFAARHLAPGDAFDTIGLVHHQRAEVRGPEHARRPFDLWTASYTAREAVRLVEDAGLEVDSVRGVEPGRYGRRNAGEVGLDDPELLLVAHRPR
jgi:SAM-dependent methyltransferase